MRNWGLKPQKEGATGSPGQPMCHPQAHERTGDTPLLATGSEETRRGRGPWPSLTTGQGTLTDTLSWVPCQPGAPSTQGSGRNKGQVLPTEEATPTATSEHCCPLAALPSWWLPPEGGPEWDWRTLTRKGVCEYWYVWRFWESVCVWGKCVCQCVGVCRRAPEPVCGSVCERVLACVSMNVYINMHVHTCM